MVEGGWGICRHRQGLRKVGYVEQVRDRRRSDNLNERQLRDAGLLLRKKSTRRYLNL